MAIRDYDYLFKIAAIGDQGVGKTTILRRYVEGDGFHNHYGSFSYVDFCLKKVKIVNEEVSVSDIKHIEYNKYSKEESDENVESLKLCSNSNSVTISSILSDVSVLDTTFKLQIWDT
mmetsp:Transcript_26276/g.23245  ORF Transcript_26276/g.23245 Transcript_26276/m.23245 type:complete len:117 (+) Transcript_26276:16-366(+)